MLYFLCSGTFQFVVLLSQLSANKTRQQFTNEVDTKMSSPNRVDGERDISIGETLRREIQAQDSSLRNIYEARMQLALRIKENLALHRAISLRQNQAAAPLERSRLRANGRMR